MPGKGSVPSIFRQQFVRPNVKGYPQESLIDSSGISNWIGPAGFQEAAVASSATPIKAPPIPTALGPVPTGLGEEATPTF